MYRSDEGQKYDVRFLIVYFTGVKNMKVFPYVVFIWRCLEGFQQCFLIVDYKREIFCRRESTKIGGN